jgi:4-hydroxy-4-methyl-2-oxoglutarate aldolase
MDYAAIFHQRYSTALIADAAYRANFPLGIGTPGLAPLDRRQKLAGPAVTVQANNDIISILAAVHYAQQGDVIVVTNKTDAVALIGDIIGGEAHHKGLAGFVIDGRVRDTVALLELDLTVVCLGMYPVGPLKLPDELKDIGKRDVALRLGEATVHPGDWVFADADGVICIAAEHLPALYEQAEQLLEREENLIANIEKGTSLSEMVALESFLEKRAKDPTADFNAHLAERKQTI